MPACSDDDGSPRGVRKTQVMSVGVLSRLLHSQLLDQPPVAGWHCRQGTKPCIPVTMLLTMLVTRDFEATVTKVKAGDARL